VQFNGKQEPFLRDGLCCPRNGQQGAILIAQRRQDHCVEVTWEGGVVILSARIPANQ
jgi:hypothetical protein